MIDESLVTDGLESFVCSQYFPINLNILIGKRSEFVYYFTESHSRRKGTTTAIQKQRMKSMYADKSFEDSKISVMFEKLLEYMCGRTRTPKVILHTDEHPVYRSVIKRWNRDEKQEIPGLDQR